MRASNFLTSNKKDKAYISRCEIDVKVNTQMHKDIASSFPDIRKKSRGKTKLIDKKKKETNRMMKRKTDQDLRYRNLFLHETNVQDGLQVLPFLIFFYS